MTEQEEYNLETLIARIFDKDPEAFHTWLVEHLRMTEDLLDDLAQPLD